MRAIILAAGLGLRLQQQPGKQFPKCLLRFDGVTLLERHLRMLDAAGVTEVVLALGFEPQQVQDELARMGRNLEIVINPRYDLGSVLTVHTVADAMTRGGDVLLMDADVLYDERIMAMSVGQFYDVVTNGVRNMPPYKPQIQLRDRWAIAAYVRTLQISRNARLEDIPADEAAARRWEIR